MENFKIAIKKNSLIFACLGIAALFLGACKPSEPIHYTSIAGAWKCTESSVKGNRSYPVDFYSKKTAGEFSISNFHNIGFEGEFDMSCSFAGNKVTLTPVENSRIRLRNGSGTVNANFTRLQMEYLVFDGTSEVRYNVVLSR